MRYLFVLLAMTGSVGAEFNVTNKAASFTVVNRVPPTPPVVKSATTYRQPVGHVHICINGHAFDHQSTAGHHCPICGATPPVNRLGQFITAPPQLIPVTPVASRPVIRIPQAMPQYQNCPNGQCPIAR